MNPIPVTVIGGYLGTGKTTLVNHLLANANGKKLAIMVNEFGELAIDEDLIEATGDDIISLAGGCVCCSYGNDLIAAMQSLSQLEPRPDNIVLEASGVALPGAIAGTLSLLPNYFLDGVLVLVDAENVQKLANDKYMRDTIERQLLDADIVVLNKIDLVPEKKLEDLQEWLPSMAPCAQIIETERSKIPPEIVLQNFVQANPEKPIGPYQHDLKFTTLKLEVSERVDPDQFAASLIVSHPLLVRAKGFVVNMDDVMKTIQIVGKRFEISDAPITASSGVVLIQRSAHNGR